MGRFSRTSRLSRQSLHVGRVPRMNRPVMVVSFQGWNDAADSASVASAYLARAWRANAFAEIDPEEFVDFTVHRPEVRENVARRREIVWPATVLSHASIPGSSSDVVVVRGFEPQIRWKTYCALLLSLARSLKVERVLTLGALLAEVAHSSPVGVSVTSTSPDLIASTGARRPRYEGPTGIIGVLHAALEEAGIPSMALWASVPFYVPQVSSAKAALALVSRAAELIGAEVDTADLEVAAEQYESEVDELVGEDEEVASYVARLRDSAADPDEAMSDLVHRDPGGHELAAEIERFLREHRHQ